MTPEGRSALATQDTIRCIVTMLTDDSAADLPDGESLFQELDRPDHGPEVRKRLHIMPDVCILCLEFVPVLSD